MAFKSRTRKAKWRALTAAIALLLVVGNVLSLLHHVVVRHVVCAEHGESVHVSADAGTGRDIDTDRRGETQSVAVGPTPHEPSESAHAHCDVWACAPAAADVAADPTADEAPELGALALAPPVAVLGRSRGPQFRLAPKNSPPDRRA